MRPTSWLQKTSLIRTPIPILILTRALTLTTLLITIIIRIATTMRLIIITITRLQPGAC